MNTKIIDSTVISVALKTIKSVNLLEKCLERYCVVTSQEVFEEIKIGFKAEILSHYFEKIEIHDLKSNTKYNEIMDYLIRRFPYLHSGELSTFLLILLIYEEENRGYYFVTDDKRMRKSINKILEDKNFIHLLKKQFTDIKQTGTIGLIKRLREKGILTKKEIDSIKEDLTVSAFRVTPKLLKELEGFEKCS